MSRSIYMCLFFSIEIGIMSALIFRCFEINSRPKEKENTLTAEEKMK